VTKHQDLTTLLESLPDFDVLDVPYYKRWRLRQSDEYWDKANARRRLLYAQNPELDQELARRRQAYKLKKRTPAQKARHAENMRRYRKKHK
jgi:hypothetical protein